jgi:hypothetical protein
MGNIIAGTIVFGALALVAFRLVSNMRKGKTGCGCEGCTACESRAKKAHPGQAESGKRPFAASLPAS